MNIVSFLKIFTKYIHLGSLQIFIKTMTGVLFCLSVRTTENFRKVFVVNYQCFSAVLWQVIWAEKLLVQSAKVFRDSIIRRISDFIGSAVHQMYVIF